MKKAINLRERKIRTQLQFVRKLIITLIVIVTICIILLSFENLRKIGAGLLTGVGIGGIIIGFAAQRSLANLLAGFQIAFTQPMRIDDVLIVEGEWGPRGRDHPHLCRGQHLGPAAAGAAHQLLHRKTIPELDRNTSEILGTVFLYLDYTAPLDAIRTEFTRLLGETKLWDRRVGIIQVTNLDKNVMEIRVLVSAANSGSAFDLRCYIRENLITFLQKNYPDALPKMRIEYSGDKPRENVSGLH